MTSDQPGKPKALIFQSDGWRDVADVAGTLPDVARLTIRLLAGEPAHA